MGSIAINQILSIGLTLDQNVGIMYEILFCENLGTIDEFSFNYKAWEKFFKKQMENYNQNISN